MRGAGAPGARGGVCRAADLPLSPVSPLDCAEPSPFSHGPDVLCDALPPASEVLRMLEAGGAVRAPPGAQGGGRGACKAFAS
jgi:hypothetical protein